MSPRKHPLGVPDPRAKAILRPSGDHAGCSSSTPAGRRFVGLVPSGFIVQTSHWPCPESSVGRTHAILPFARGVTTGRLVTVKVQATVSPASRSTFALPVTRLGVGYLSGSTTPRPLGSMHY